MLRCHHCDAAIGAPRGRDRIRMAKLPVTIIRRDDDGAQWFESICPRCRKNIRFRLPLPDDTFRS